MGLRLEIVSRHSLGERSSKEFGPNGGTIGRSLESDWVLPDSRRYLSSRHASIDHRAGSYYIIDTSTNGVYVNDSDQPVGRGNPQRLFSNDRIRIGDYVMRVTIDETDDTGEHFVDAPHVDPVDTAMRVEAPVAATQDLVGEHEITGVGLDLLLDDEQAQSLAAGHPASKGSESSEDSEEFDLSSLSLEDAGDGDGDAGYGDAHTQTRPDPSAPVSDNDEHARREPAEAPQTPASGASHASSAASSSASSRTSASGQSRAPGPAYAATPGPSQAAAQTSTPKPSQASGQTSTPRPSQAAGQTSTSRRHSQTAAQASTPGPSQAAAQPQAGRTQQADPRRTGTNRNAGASEGGNQGAFNAFLTGAGLPPQALDQNEVEQVMHTLGRMMRETVTGLTENLHLRAVQKSSLKQSSTAIQAQDNNPLKLAGGVDETLQSLLLGGPAEHMPPVDAVRGAFKDLKLHQQALLRALHTALERYIERLDPDTVEEQLSSSRRGALLGAANKLKYWDYYKDLYLVVAQHPSGALPAQFLEELARAYDEELGKTQARPADEPEANVG